MKATLFTAILFILIGMFPSELTAGEQDDPSKRRGKVKIPPHAVEIAPRIFRLETAMDKGRVVEGYAIVTQRKGKFAKPGCNNNGICEPGEKNNCADCKSSETDQVDSSSCFDYTRGARWKTEEDFIVNPDNVRGLDPQSIMFSLYSSIEKWELAANYNEILGNGSLVSYRLEADLVEPDDQNEVYFADVDYPDAIAVTIIWGIFRGPQSWRELVEWDQVYDDVDFDWSDDCEGYEDCSDKMDFKNIAIHELGHSVGLNDLYDASCSEQTMYGYADFGETKKRTLEDGDVMGVWELYH